jgi:hyperosmotically inducible protein
LTDEGTFPGWAQLWAIHPMKTSFQKTAAAVAVAAALLFASGCSRGENERTAGQSVDDAAVTAKVKTAFAKDPGVRAIDVNVNTFRGTVQLSGWVNTAEEKAKAEEVAKTIPGVKSVDNQLSIKTDVTKPKAP